MKKEWIKKGVIVSAVILSVVVILLFLLRGVILSQYIQKKVQQIEQRFDVDIHIGKTGMTGISTLFFEDLSLVQPHRDTLFTASSLTCTISPFKLLMGDIDVTDMQADKVNIDFIKKDSLSNFDFLYQRKDTVSSSNNTVDYARMAQQMLKMVFHILPSHAQFTHFEVSYIHNNYTLTVVVPDFLMENNVFNAHVESVENGVRSNWVVDGLLTDRKKQLECSIIAEEKQKITLPFLEHRLGAKVTFDTLRFILGNTSISGGVLPVAGAATVHGLHVNHPRISPQDVVLEKGRFDFRFNVGDTYLEMDSATVVQFNKIDIHPYVRIENKAGKRVLKASLNKKHFSADDFFTSLPGGLFYNLEGLKVSGNLSYHFLFEVDMDRIDSLRFESELVPENFKILKFGNTPLTRMNTPFIYTAYDKDIPVRSFEVGEGNPNFRKLEQISPFLQMAVLQSEDGDFFGHKGFRIDCLQEALAADIKARRFVRGGSTISMQLVKNVFLNRNKNIARKLEEALIVWLIENNRLTSKNRMYEVYLNIIEWGPRVYGANEASRFYFDKDASQLTAEEAIFLSALIPRPKQARWFFSEDRSLRPFLEGYFRTMAGRLKQKGLLTETEAAVVKPEVVLSGPSLEMFQRKELLVDTTITLQEVQLLP